ncbi:MAG: SurA N-terminal domain-containing protein [Alphaproteobacteria bacterium]|nr:SurA N-terminal domain-containing protein [Alphaproteobacteria bacterium]
MIRLGMVSFLVLFAFNVKANEIDMGDIDRGVRSSKSRSIMFSGGNENVAREMLERQRIEEEKRKKTENEARLKKEQQVFRPYNLFGNGYKISAIINGEMVSNKDLQERANLFSLTTGLMVGEKNKEMVKDKVLQNTIDEKLKLQEASKLGVVVSESDVREAYNNFEKSNGVPRGKFVNVLKEYHVSKDMFMTQIKANLLWNKLVARKVGRNIGVSSKEIEDEFLRIKKDMKTPKYMVSEIVIKKKDGEHIDELVEILQNDPRFELYAVQFSQSASAPSGGKLGWITSGQLAAPLDRAIKGLKEGGVSKAILYRNEYYIFRLDKVYKPGAKEKELPSEDEVRKFIENRKSDEIANKYIRDLRNKAVVEKKF